MRRGELERLLELLAGAQLEPATLVEHSERDTVLGVPLIELRRLQIVLLGHPLPALIGVLHLALAEEEVEARILRRVADRELPVLDGVVVVGLAQELLRL